PPLHRGGLGPRRDPLAWRGHRRGPDLVPRDDRDSRGAGARAVPRTRERGRDAESHWYSARGGAGMSPQARALLRERRRRIGRIRKRVIATSLTTFAVAW